MAYIFYPTPTPVFPTLPTQAWSVHKQPSLVSTVSKAISGKEFQIIRAVVPRWEFTLSFGGDSWLRDQTQNITPNPNLAGFEEFQAISGLFVQCLGSYGEFYFNDPDDNSRAANPLAVGDGTTTQFQVYVYWGIGPTTPPPFFPCQGIQEINQVYFNGTPTSAGFTLDSTNTQVIFDSPPGNGVAVTIDFTFYYRCRFLADIQEYEQWALDLWQQHELKFQSVKP